MRLVKARFGGERQWCEVLQVLEDDRLRVRVDNVPARDGAPFNSVRVIYAEEVLDELIGPPPAPPPHRTGP